MLLGLFVRTRWVRAEAVRRRARRLHLVDAAESEGDEYMMTPEQTAAMATMVERLSGEIREGKSADKRDGMRAFLAAELPQRLRDEMRFAWSAVHQRKFDRLTTVLSFFNRLLPRAIRQLPYSVLMWDFRRRIRHRMPLV